MMFRGFMTATMAFIGLRGILGKVDKFTWLIAFTMPLATLGLFQGIRHWGTGPTIIVVTATPLVNFVVSFFLGRKVSGASVVALVLMIGGVVLARRGEFFQWKGFIWSVIGTIMNGILYEFFARAKSNSLQKCFYACMGMGILGLVLSFRTPLLSIMSPKLTVMLLVFAFVGGFLYWIANLLAFQNLPTAEASVLAQGETPAVIIGAYFILGESLTYVQSLGVGISLFGAWYLSRWLSDVPKKEGKG